MIKTHKGYLQGNYPRIITKENKKSKKKDMLELYQKEMFRY